MTVARESSSSERFAAAPDAFSVGDRRSGRGQGEQIRAPTATRGRSDSASHHTTCRCAAELAGTRATATVAIAAKRETFECSHSMSRVTIASSSPGALAACRSSRRLHLAQFLRVNILVTEQIHHQLLTRAVEESRQQMGQRAASRLLAIDDGGVDERASFLLVTRRIPCARGCGGWSGPSCRPGGSGP